MLIDFYMLIVKLHLIFMKFTSKFRTFKVPTVVLYVEIVVGLGKLYRFISGNLECLHHKSVSKDFEKHKGG